MGSAAAGAFCGGAEGPYSWIIVGQTGPGRTADVGLADAGPS